MLPNPSKKRLLQLQLLLTQLTDEFITSIQIEGITGWKDTTVRKDISYILKIKKIASTSSGYNRLDLQRAIASVLQISSIEDKKNCCIVGLGKIAQGILRASDFENSSFSLKVGFDTSINRVETFNAPFPLFTMSKLKQKILEHKIEYAILDVDDNEANEIAKKLSTAGIKGIVNYTHTILSVQKTTKVKNVSVIASLQELAY